MIAMLEYTGKDLQKGINLHGGFVSASSEALFSPLAPEGVWSIERSKCKYLDFVAV